MNQSATDSPAVSGFQNLDVIERLQIARRGSSYFAQQLAELSDADLDEATLLPGWTRRHLIAHVGYNAAALGRLLDWALTGTETPMYASPEHRNQEINEGATLNGGALRNLYDHTAARLDHKWRNFPPEAWLSEVRTAQGRTVPASETLWVRTREVWIHTVDLNGNRRFGDFPGIVIDTLLSDIVSLWRKKAVGHGLVLEVSGCAPIAVDPDRPTHTTVTGTAAAVVRWASGRGACRLAIEGPADTPPRWL
ncbi:maleylpyruvate isomerase family mycothiol-dependent enzyme [Mycolicibacterium baixiangningiae]|uniref:maleylpyruvate isomerase family mycothiol-dependent enzyme n=1 Tax=Mycolicibacterium baixiangningiae TaxID=2761578 RepID=UPI001865BA35|nr:maleylpyruvate isomerase family mycothiol-dependent enzyme [Mycolicibacterium baixiangningiae]